MSDGATVILVNLTAGAVDSWSATLITRFQDNGSLTITDQDDDVKAVYAAGAWGRVVWVEPDTEVS